MEAYLDWQKKSSGIKLNDVIEEYRYVANGKSVKKGDFLTYVGKDVAPAIEPPFNAVALSSGVGAPEFVEGEVKKTGNIFAKTWNEVTLGTEYMAYDGTILSASSNYSSTDNISRACDNNAKTNFQSNSETTHWIKIKLPNAIKITKMATYIGSYNPGVFTNAIIQGSNDDSSWNDLYTITSEQNSLSEITLNNPDYYQYYQILVNLPASTRVNVFEWQTSEYMVIEQIPSTEHNGQVKIARLPIELMKTGNIFAKNWTEVSETECTADDGSKLTASSSHSSSLSVYSACDGNVGTYWYANQTHTNTQLSEVLIELPNACKITKMRTYITTNDDDGNVGKYFGYATIKGTKGNGEWVDLYTIEAVQTELTEISLENADEYIAYKIEISTTAITKYVRPRIYEWQTSEYVEVI